MTPIIFRANYEELSNGKFLKSDQSKCERKVLKKRTADLQRKLVAAGFEYIGNDNNDLVINRENLNIGINTRELVKHVPKLFDRLRGDYLKGSPRKRDVKVERLV
ncbi:MAG: hypothetical protein ACOH15_04300 [Acetobacterium sp.]